MPVAVVGATGYTGAELCRLLLGHPRVDLVRLTGRGTAGRPVADVLPSLRGVWDGDVSAFDPDALAGEVRVAFCALPHGASAGVVEQLRARNVVTFDLSADFRLRDLAVYQAWYGEHAAPGRLAEAAYGLVELHREAIEASSLIAVPGCYPTASILVLAPLLRAGLVAHEGIVVDAKSGVSGAGRSPTPSTHLPEASEGVRSYKVGGVHRHIAEIEQELSRLSGAELCITFTPHLVPMTRGILATAYARRRSEDVSAEACTEAAAALYEGSPSVVLLPPGTSPDTLWVRGSNRAYLSYTVDRKSGMVIAQAAIDNLVKGAAGQAVQCMNVRFGIEESAGLGGLGVWP